MHRILVAALLCVASCEWVADPEDFAREDVLVMKSSKSVPPPANPRRLKVMAWNIKYGACRIDFWFDFWGDRTQMSVSEVEGCLEKVAALVKEYDPDILLNEEIELNSRRSAYVDMPRFILDHTNLQFAAYFETWDARYIPSEGLGRLNLGNAIFSKYPIKKAERIKEIERTDEDALTHTFTIKRAVGRAVIDLGTSGEVAAYVVHTEAYDQDGTKQKQITQIHELLKGEALPFVIGGDFNELPPVCDEKAADASPESCKDKLNLKGFIDERASASGSMFEQPPYTPSVMKPLYADFNPFITLARYGIGEAAHQRYFTHSVLGPDIRNDDGVAGRWNRTLDYFFIKKDDAWVDGTTTVLQQKGDTVGDGAGGTLTVQGDPIRLSDHAPIVGMWDLAPVTP